MSDAPSPTGFITERRTPKKVEVIDLCDSPEDNSRRHSIAQTPTVDLSPYIGRNKQNEGSSSVNRVNITPSFHLSESILDSPDSVESSVESCPSTASYHSERETGDRRESVQSRPSSSESEAEFDDPDNTSATPW